MTVTAEELKELAVLARESGDEDLELQALEQLDALSQQQPIQSQQDTKLSDVDSVVGGLGMEAVSGANKAIAGIIDTFGTDTINAALELGGFESRVPTLTSAISAPKGQFTEGTIAEGLPTDIAAGAGGFAVNALTGQGLIRQGANNLAPLAASTGARVLRQAAQPGLAATAATGGASGAGEQVGRDVGGESGALVGAIAAPIAGIAALGGAKAAITKLGSKFGRNIGLIDQQTALPTPAFQKALDKRGVQYGSLIDDVDNLPVLQGRQNADDVVESILRRKLINNSTDDVTATLRLEGNRIVPDQLGEEALKQGFTAGRIASVKGMNANTKKEAVRMLNMERQILANASKADDFRPTDVVGDNSMQRFDFIRGKADILRNDLDKLANKPFAGNRSLSGPGVTTGLKGQQINGAKVEDSMISSLQKIFVDIPEEVLKDTQLLPKFLKGKGVFVGSDISKDPTSQKIIKDVVDLLNEGGSDAFGAHRIKRQLDRLIDFNKKSAQGLTKEGKNFAKEIRFSLNESIREVNPQYAKINDELSLSIESMNNFQKALGPSIDVFEKGATKAVGQDLKGLLSNRKTRVNLENAVNSLDDAANKLGGNFDVNVKSLTRFANTLDDRFGAVAETSMKGEMAGALNQAARGKAGAVDFALQKTAESAEKLRGINDTNALNTLTKILKR